MIPSDIHQCLKKVFLLRFNEEPNYEEIITNLTNCFQKVVQAETPKCPPSISNSQHNQNMYGAPGKDMLEGYHYEWNRTYTNKIRRNLMAQDNQL